jgi:hypothetical protein
MMSGGLPGLFWSSAMMMLAAPSALPQGLTVQTNAEEVVYTSPWLKVAFSSRTPTMTFLSVDATGTSRHSRNLLEASIGGGPSVTTPTGVCSLLETPCVFSRTGNVVRYAGVKLGQWETDSYRYTIKPKEIDMVIDRDVPQDYDASQASPLRVMFDATVTPVSPLGRVKQGELGKMQFPLLLHFPDWGSLLVRAREQGKEESTWDFSLFRDLKPVAPGAVARWRPMTAEERKKVEITGNKYLLSGGNLHIGPEQIQLALHHEEGDAKQRAGKQRIKLSMAVTAIYPEPKLVDADPKLVGVKRAWLNIFGFRADLGCLANSSTGDTCQFCLHCYADQAYYTPPLFDDFTALDLVRVSLDRYFDGFKGYRSDFQDVAPSTIIAAWDYATGKPDPAWLKRRIGDIETYAERMIAMDVDGDGLCESPKSPSNWWDMINWNWKDAYSSALAWRAFRCAADLEHRLGNQAKAQRYAGRAEKIRAIYYQTFYNPETGVLAGWRAKDGTFGDRYFLFANGIAIAYGLVDKAQANAILDRLQAKLQEVGYHNFQYGLPGNLVAFPHRLPFQIYENGGATGSMAYYYVQALYAAGRQAEAEAIFDRMLEGYRDGTFQNGIGNGGDWKEWNGTPCGYEGMLVDAYYPLTALITGRLGRGVPLPASGQGRPEAGARR